MSRPALRFHLVDVFAIGPLTGNPLAVVEATNDLPVDLCRRIAGEFNLSETTFVLPPSRPDADMRLRSFTAAGVEVFGAGGHNTLGAWWWLAEAGKVELDGDYTTLHQELGHDVLPLVIERAQGKVSRVVMQQRPPVAGAIVDDHAALAAALRLDTAELAAGVVPCQVRSTGAAHLLVPVRDRRDVDRVRPDVDALLPILRAAGGEGCYVFSLDPLDQTATAYARFFNPTAGISEDPATGTAAGPLAVHLRAAGLTAAPRIVIEQGTAMGRKSLIDVIIDGDEVSISARCVVIGHGELVV